MSDIDEFEKRFPVPDGVFWSEDFRQYEAESMEFEPDADLHHEKWQVWQAAREQGGDSQAPAPIVEALGVLVSNNLRPDVQGKLKALINGWREQQGGEAVAEVTQGHMTGVSFFENTEFGTQIPAGTKLYTHPAPSIPDPDLQLAAARDYWEEKATELAEDVGKYLGLEFGEHSSANCPVQNAIDALNNEPYPSVPNEHGKNRYGLDMAYFRNLFNRELNRPLVDFRPDELARVLTRAARTADASVLREPEFQSGSAPDWVVSGVWQFYQDGEWRVGMNCNNHRENTEEAGIPVRDLHVPATPPEGADHE